MFDTYLNYKISYIPDHWSKDSWQRGSSLFKIACLLIELEVLKKKNIKMSLLWSETGELQAP